MDIKDLQIDFLRWVLENCKNSPFDALVVENIKVKKMLPDNQDMLYLDSDSDMNTLYELYKKDSE